MLPHNEQHCLHEYNVSGRKACELCEAEKQQCVEAQFDCVQEVTDALQSDCKACNAPTQRLSRSHLIWANISALNRTPVQDGTKISRMKYQRVRQKWFSVY